VFDDTGTVKIVVIDGGSREDLRRDIRAALGAGDVFACEPDKGIFDALNKGLAICENGAIGWLGSDDLYTGRVKASEVTALLGSHDMVVTDAAYFQGGRVRRLTHALPCRYLLARYGFNVPHFGSFVRRTLIAERRFDIADRCADIDFFNALFSLRPQVATVGKTGLLAELGGFSTASGRKILMLNIGLVGVYQRYVGPIVAPLSVVIKMSYKIVSSMYYRVVRVEAREICVPELEL
jgi:glycosyltransferase